MGMGNRHGSSRAGKTFLILFFIYLKRLAFYIRNLPCFAKTFVISKILQVNYSVSHSTVKLSPSVKHFCYVLSALYQLHLVNAEIARAFIPKELKLVEAFGYTLGGFFLANYDESPAGVFDELVVIAGIVWNPPTSCAWAARVLVNSNEACAHGRKHVGLPSQVARFSKRVTATPRHSHSKINRFLNTIGVGTASDYAKSCIDIQVTEIKGPAVTDLCTINISGDGLANPDAGQNSNKFVGPVINMSLPSFSGRTEFNPHLLKYSCQIKCRIRAVQLAKVSGPSTSQEDETVEQSHTRDLISQKLGEKGRNLCMSVLLSKPILALEFNSLNMEVQAPVVSCFSSKNAPTGS